MKFLIIIGSLIVPIGMFWLQYAWPKSRSIFNICALFAALTFGNLAAISIQQILHDNTVFMTNIHGVLLNPFFLLAGSYLGVYLFYRFMIWTSSEW
ncbi:transposase [Fictibacillus sp. b24]|uniref:transposase n=1 Tax=Fictibacillus sp. b24 TaxID=3055863 RepID=UPI0025A30611|nr:transposase [Fictibacillus sp. b24]MDM5317307.1 transposase [Fictibacillus sp. b24]